MKPTKKGHLNRSQQPSKTTPSSTSSSKRSAASASIVNTNSEEMYNETELWNGEEETKPVSRKTSKLSRHDFKHHKIQSVTPRRTLLESMYQNCISEFENKNWRLTA